jgi:D-alanyl-D-alanine carboxypeptidase
MRRAINDSVSWLVLAVVASLGAACCTLTVTAPIEPPPESWDPAVNTHPDGALFQELLDRYVREGLPGVVLLVRTPLGQWNGASGYAKVETQVPMVPTSRHHAASVTKMYTATAVMLLAEDGLIDLDAEIREYLPESIWKPIPNGDGATVRQLLGHTSGIPDFSGALAYDLDFLNDPFGSYPPERLLSYLHGQSAIFAPGNGYFYSNAGYLLLALIMDSVTGGSHAEVISERVLEPMGLGATFYRNEPGYPTPPGLVNSYQDMAGDGRLMNVSDMATHSLEVFFGNAGLIATSADFAAFLEGLMDGELVGQESLSEMQEWRERSRYGLGLNFIETPFGPGIGHSGGDTGVLTQVRRFPELDATLVLLCNGGDGGVPARLFNRLWAEAMEAALSGL